MKKQLYLLFLLLACYGTPLVASAATGLDNPLLARAKALTQQIAAKAHLSEGQYVKVKQLNLRMLTTVESLKKQYATDADMLDQRLAEVQNNYEWDLATILQPRQMMAYDEAKVTMTAVNLH